MGFSKPLTRGVTYVRRRLAGSFQVLGKRTGACSIEQRFQVCVAANAWSEALAIGLPERVDASVSPILIDGAGRIGFVTTGDGSHIPLAALSDSFLWHGSLSSNCSEPEQPIPLDHVRLGRLVR